MAGPVREKIRLVSSEGTGHFYTTTKNKRLHPEKMETKKFDPVVLTKNRMLPSATNSRYGPSNPRPGEIPQIPA